MGTRSLTFVYGYDDAAIVNMYRQFDGYMEGHGQELAEFLNSFEAITNGIRVGETRRTANGMGCLAAQMVAHFKDGAGQFYLYPVSARDCGQDYEYHVYENRVVVKYYNGKIVFEGNWAEFLETCNAEETAE